MSVVESRVTGHTVYPGTCFTVPVGNRVCLCNKGRLSSARAGDRGVVRRRRYVRRVGNDADLVLAHSGGMRDEYVSRLHVRESPECFSLDVALSLARPPMRVSPQHTRAHDVTWSSEPPSQVVPTRKTSRPALGWSRSPSSIAAARAARKELTESRQSDNRQGDSQGPAGEGRVCRGVPVSAQGRLHRRRAGWAWRGQLPHGQRVERPGVLHPRRSERRISDRGRVNLPDSSSRAS
jgi:hypothetical protein